MTLFLLIFLSIVVALVTLVLLSLALNTATASQIANSDWAKALGWVVSAAIIALAAVSFVDRMPL